MTHDYKRHGTTTLFAALNVLEGTVIGSCLARHRHQEFRKFLNLLDAQTPPDVAIHAILDNHGADAAAAERNARARAVCALTAKMVARLVAH